MLPRTRFAQQRTSAWLRKEKGAHRHDHNHHQHRRPCQHPAPAGCHPCAWVVQRRPAPGAVVNHVNAETRRCFLGTSRRVSCPDVPNITVSIDGYQHADGHAVRYIVVDTVHTDNPLPRTWPAASSQRGPRRPTKSTRWPAATSP